MCSLRYLNGRTLSPFPAEAGQTNKSFATAFIEALLMIYLPNWKGISIGGRQKAAMSLRGALKNAK